MNVRAQVRRFLTKNPKSRADQIAAGVGLEVPVVSAVLRSMRDEGEAKSRGNTRGTVWAVK